MISPPQALAELWAKLGVARKGVLIVSPCSWDQWPLEVVNALKAAKILARAPPAKSAVCPGCEEACMRPVHTLTGDGDEVRSFVLCDRRRDINRVALRKEALEQWQASGAAVARWLSGSLALVAVDPGGGDVERWEVGLLKTGGNSAHVVLYAGSPLTLRVAGHSIALADVVDWRRGALMIERKLLDRCVANPAAGGGDAESAEARRARLQERINQERAKGNRAFVQHVADEEGVTPRRLQQILNAKRSKQFDDYDGAGKPPTSASYKPKKA